MCPGSGLSGWKYEHLKLLLRSTHVQSHLFAAYSALAQGNLPSDAVTLFSASRLIALPKGSNDVSPIAMGEVFRRVVAKAICLEMKSQFSDHFSPIQHGVTAEGGVELLVQHIQALLDENADWVCLKTDVKNAFNSVSRRHLLEELLSSFPSLYGHAFSMYGNTSLLVYTLGSESLILESQDRVHQGDPLGPALFAIAINKILSKLQRHHSTVVILAYLDDVFICGPSLPCLAVFQDFKVSLAPAGLVICDRKCQAYSPSSQVGWPESISLTCSGMEILGTPIGDDDYITSQCLSFAESGRFLCGKLSELNDPQCALLLLRHCHNTRLNHLARTIPPSLLQSAAQFHDNLTCDNLTCETFCHALQLDVRDPRKWSQCCLPVRQGGFELCQLQQVTSAAVCCCLLLSAAVCCCLLLSHSSPH